MYDVARTEYYGGDQPTVMRSYQTKDTEIAFAISNAKHLKCISKSTQYRRFGAKFRLLELRMTCPGRMTCLSVDWCLVS